MMRAVLAGGRLPGLPGGDFTGAVAALIMSRGDDATKQVLARVDRSTAHWKGNAMRLSTRNQLKGTVASVDVGAVMTIVKVDLDGGQQVTAAITRDGAEELNLEVGQPVVALVKATEVMLGVE